MDLGVTDADPLDLVPVSRHFLGLVIVDGDLVGLLFLNGDYRQLFAWSRSVT